MEEMHTSRPMVNEENRLEGGEEEEKEGGKKEEEPRTPVTPITASEVG